MAELSRQLSEAKKVVKLEMSQESWKKFGNRGPKVIAGPVWVVFELFGGFIQFLLIG
jgi:hypothetical protein